MVGTVYRFRHGPRPAAGCSAPGQELNAAGGSGGGLPSQGLVVPQTASAQRCGQVPIGGWQVVAEYLDADVIGAGFEVFPETPGDGFRVAMEYQGVDQPVAAAVGQ